MSITRVKSENNMKNTKKHIFIKSLANILIIFCFCKSKKKPHLKWGQFKGENKILRKLKLSKNC
jgi:hypothetical protein